MGKVSLIEAGEVVCWTTAVESFWLFQVGFPSNALLWSNLEFFLGSILLSLRPIAQSPRA